VFLTTLFNLQQNINIYNYKTTEIQLSSQTTREWLLMMIIMVMLCVGDVGVVTVEYEVNDIDKVKKHVVIWCSSRHYMDIVSRTFF